MTSNHTRPAATSSSDQLGPGATDYTVAALRAALGAVPVAGSALSELVGTIVPRQRIDRIADFAQKVGQGLRDVDEALLRTQLANENFTGLLEDAVRQAAQAVTEERRAYLARVIATGLDETKVSFVESRFLLRILGEVNDIEIIWLRYYLFPYINGDDEFRDKHAAVLEPISIDLSTTDPRAHDRAALQNNYLSHLVSLGLLRRPLALDRSRQPVFDPMTHDWKTTGHQLSGLGKLLLKHIGFSEAQPDHQWRE